MLEGLDDVNWAELKHAYGVATDVPTLLRALLSEEQGVRQETIADLFGNIWHQGTVYSASAAAIPFLYQLLTAPEVPDKEAIAILLASLAEGTGYLEVHTRSEFGASSWRSIYEKQGKTLEDEVARELAVTASVHRAASAGLPLLLPFLSDPNTEIRTAIASVLGHYPEHTARSLPAIQTALATERDEDVRKMLIASQTALTSNPT